MANKPKPETIHRMQVIASPQQIDIITKAADEAGVSRSTWLLAHGLRVAQGAEHELVVLSEKSSAKVRQRAQEQGTTPDELISLLLV